MSNRGRRLGLVVSPTESPLSVVTVVPTSTSAQSAIHRPEMEIAGRLTRLLVDQIRTIGIDHVHGDPVDYLGWRQLRVVEAALAHYLGLVDSLVNRAQPSDALRPLAGSDRGRASRRRRRRPGLTDPQPLGLIRATSSPRLRTATLAKIDFRWSCTVFGEMNSCAAISAVE